MPSASHVRPNGYQRGESRIKSGGYGRHSSLRMFAGRLGKASGAEPHRGCVTDASDVAESQGTDD